MEHQENSAKNRWAIRGFDFAAKFVLNTLLVAISLVAALTTRFLFIASPLARTTGSYWDYVTYSTLAIQNAFYPGLLVGLLAFGIYRLVGSNLFVKTNREKQLFLDLIAISAYFTIVAVVILFLPEDFTFPRITWALAWLYSVIIFTTYSITRQFSLGLRDQIPFNRTTQIFIDLVVIFAAFIFSYFVRFDGLPTVEYQKQMIFTAPYVVLLYLAVNGLWGVNRFVWRFTSIQESLIIALSVASSALVLLVSRILILGQYDLLRIPFGILLIHPALCFVGLLGVRGLRRIQHRWMNRSRRNEDIPAKRVLLVGAGRAGSMLVQELREQPDYQIVGFLDDDISKKRRLIHGIRVLGTTKELSEVVKDLPVDEIILSMPTAPKKTVRKIVSLAKSLEVPVSSVPSLSEILLGKVRVGRLRPVRMEDLLGRDSVEFPASDKELQSAYHKRRILVTGAAGSIGSELVNQLKEFEPTELILVDKDENGLYERCLDLQEVFPGEIHQIVADTRDKNRIFHVFEKRLPEVIFHAAAYKHVPMMELNPMEAVTSNIVGTRNMVEAATEFGANIFVLISTDKAVNPTSIMGASKRVAEMVVRDQALHGGKTRYCCVRFGNVLGSRASVIPLFQKRIAEGKDIKVTHPEIKRYFMTIPEASQLVIQAGSLATDGETFVLDMGDPVRIVDLAKDLIEQSGLVIGEDIDIEFTGLRPGEKLFEELLVDETKGFRSTKYSKIFVEQRLPYDSSKLRRSIEQLVEAACNSNTEAICEVFLNLGIGFQRKVLSIEKRIGTGQKD